MNLLKQTKKLCSLYNIKPARSKGQNFLIKEDVYDKIIESAGLREDDVVLEVGPGLGFLTKKLAEKAKKAITVELDDKLAKIVAETLQGSDCAVINENILDIAPEKLGLKNNNFKIVANLPYNITSIFLRRFLSAKIKPELMVLMLQKEVAKRIIAKPSEMSLLAVSVQYFSEPEIIEYVPANNFWPEPKVDSAIIKIKIRKTKRLESVDKERDFFRLVKIGFSSKRKMLKNNLAAGYRIKQAEAENRLKLAGFNLKIRAQELSVNDWLKLFGEFKWNVV